MSYYKNIFLLAVAFWFAETAIAQEKLSENIRLNQVGYYPAADKIAVIVGNASKEFLLSTPERNQKSLNVKLS
jgi:endoglucanase